MAVPITTPVLTGGVPDVRGTWGNNGQIVMARGAKDERLV